jgi:hypothetical protein
MIISPIAPDGDQNDFSPPQHIGFAAALDCALAIQSYCGNKHRFP